MERGPAATEGARELSQVTHDLRSALAAAVAYLDLARERVARGEQVSVADLEPVERNLAKLQAKLAELDHMARGAKR